jgi:hypothetical protein
VDLLRKLALSGLLQFVNRGTAAQCFCGSVVAFASFGLQQWLRPYREAESNILKALVDTQLFLTFLISFILRVLPEIDSAEPFGAVFYGWLLLSTMIVLLCCAFGLTLRQLRRRQAFKDRCVFLSFFFCVIIPQMNVDSVGLTSIPWVCLQVARWGHAWFN